MYAVTVRMAKRCPRCTQTKPLGEFIRPRSGTFSDYCHPCRQAKRRDEYARAGGSDASYRQVLKRSGLTFSAYQAQFEAQHGVCAACFLPETVKVSGGNPRRLGVDVDEKTGQVRGLLCAHCTLLVNVLADAELVAAVRAYLEGGQQL
jgi:hypothetical protein